MRDLVHRALFAGVVLSVCSAWGQMHKVAKPEQVVRAVGVYEWTGEMAKPTASRLIPVSIFIDGKLEDAGVYVSRPVPFALQSGNVYELQDAGIDKGFLDLAYARHLKAVDATGDLAYDDGWFGYGSVKPLAAAKRPTKLKPSKTLPVLTTSSGSTTDANRPHLDGKTSGGDQGKATSNPTSSTSTSTSTTSADDPDRPTMKRRSSGSSGSSGSGSSGGDASTDTGGTSTSSGGASSGGTNPSASTKNAGGASADDPDRPTMKRRSDSTANNGDDSTSSTASSGKSTTGKNTTETSTASADDPDRPTMKRRSDSTANGSDGSTSTASSSTGSGPAPADDPDRPTMKRRSSDSSSDSSAENKSSTASTGGSSGAPSDDPDRPTLKRHTAEDTKKAKNGGNDTAMVTGGGSLNDDPGRPNLHRGKPTGAMTEDDLPKLVGLPVDLHQMVAVSDAADRDPHEFALTFDGPAERAAVLQKMQEMAQAQLAAYGRPAAPKTASVVTKSAVSRRTAPGKSRRASTPTPVVAELLMDEQLKAYTLSYGGAATYVYTAHTAGTGAALRYVTIVAQADGLGELKPAIQSVTDAAHLDQTPRMRFVDVVDAEANNRASLLFELRGQGSRQFGLYRVIAAHSEQIFLTGSTQ